MGSTLRWSHQLTQRLHAESYDFAVPFLHDLQIISALSCYMLWFERVFWVWVMRLKQGDGSGSGGVVPAEDSVVGPERMAGSPDRCSALTTRGVPYLGWPDRRYQQQ